MKSVTNFPPFFTQVYANVVMAIRAHIVTNVLLIRDAKMASALSHGSAIASQIGVEYYAISVSKIIAINRFDLDSIVFLIAASLAH